MKDLSENFRYIILNLSGCDFSKAKVVPAHGKVYVAFPRIVDDEALGANTKYEHWLPCIGAA